jgi:hypothetical protein
MPAVRDSPTPAVQRSFAAAARAGSDPSPTPSIQRRLAPGALATVQEPSPAPRPEMKSRLSGDELIADLFETMHALDFCKDSLEGADFTLKLAMGKLASTVGMVHLYDIDKREFVVVRAAGPGAEALEGLRTKDDDPLASEVLCSSDAIIIADAANDSRAYGDRWAALRAAVDPREVTAIASARVAKGGRFLGLLELANLAGGGTFTGGDEHALGYIAEHFTDFVAEHGVLLNDDG